MTKKRVRDLVARRENFLVLAEFVPLPGHRLSNFEAFLTGYAERGDRMPSGFEVAGVTIPQSPGGVASMSPVDIYAILDKKGLWGDLDVMPHVTSKDHNADAIESYLVGVQQLGMESVLALTGDKPTQAQGVFEIDSIGLIELINEMNNRAFEKATPDQFDQVPQFYIGAAVSPFKYTEPSLLQQYYKMAKKVQVGADCLITQLGWDYRKSEELFRYLREERIDTPVFGNVYFLTTMTPAPRLMYEGKLPGCVVTQELFDAVRNEQHEDHLERAALQVAMYRDLGAVGVDLGGIFDFDMLLQIVRRAAEIGPDWRSGAARLDYGVAGGFYLYDEQGRRRPLSRTRRKLSQRNFNVFHNMLFEPGKGIRGPVKKLFSLSKTMRQGEDKGMARVFHALFEKPMKSLLFHCEECGDCFLYENFSLCSIGRCEKGLDNPPCGDANADGTCGNNEKIRCVGELIYEAAASDGEAGLRELARRLNPKRNPQLEGTASILNNFFDRDHCRRIGLVRIGDNLHSLVPKVAAAMEMLLDKGADAYEKPSGALSYLVSLISGQAGSGADYIAVNVDKFAKDDVARAAELMRYYVKLVQRYGQGTPVCIDSRHAEVLKAGLAAWYATADQPPLLRSITPALMDEILPCRAAEPFRVMVLLTGDGGAGKNGSLTSDDLVAVARQVYDTAVGKYGFAPQDVFVELPVKPLVLDTADDGQPARTHVSFTAARRIRQDGGLKGMHAALSLAGSAVKAPGRSIGLARAYLAKAQEYGVDAAMVDTTKQYGITPAGDDLLTLVDTFARQDGSAAARSQAQQALDKFMAANTKSKR